MCSSLMMCHSHPAVSRDSVVETQSGLNPCHAAQIYNEEGMGESPAGRPFQALRGVRAEPTEIGHCPSILFGTSGAGVITDVLIVAFGSPRQGGFTRTSEPSCSCCGYRWVTDSSIQAERLAVECYDETTIGFMAR